MRVAALLVLAFASLFSLWAITGMHIMRCALTITLIESVEMEDDAELEQWLLSFVSARSEAGVEYRE
jgi:hypothetical protein